MVVFGDEGGGRGPEMAVGWCRGGCARREGGAVVVVVELRTTTGTGLGVGSRSPLSQVQRRLAWPLTGSWTGKAPSLRRKLEP